MLLLAKTQPPILYVRTIYDHPRYVDRLFRDWYDITQLPKDDLKVTVNFNYCEFLGHIGVAFLGGMVRLLEAHGADVTFDWNTLTLVSQHFILQMLNAIASASPADCILLIAWLGQC